MPYSDSLTRAHMRASRNNCCCSIAFLACLLSALEFAIPTGPPMVAVPYQPAMDVDVVNHAVDVMMWAAIVPGVGMVASTLGALGAWRANKVLVSISMAIAFVFFHVYLAAALWPLVTSDLYQEACLTLEQACSAHAALATNSGEAAVAPAAAAGAVGALLLVAGGAGQSYPATATTTSMNSGSGAITSAFGNIQGGATAASGRGVLLYPSPAPSEVGAVPPGLAPATRKSPSVATAAGAEQHSAWPPLPALGSSQDGSQAESGVRTSSDGSHTKSGLQLGPSDDLALPGDSSDNSNSRSARLRAGPRGLQRNRRLQQDEGAPPCDMLLLESCCDGVKRSVYLSGAFGLLSTLSMFFLSLQGCITTRYWKRPKLWRATMLKRQLAVEDISSAAPVDAQADPGSSAGAASELPKAGPTPPPGKPPPGLPPAHANKQT